MNIVNIEFSLLKMKTIETLSSFLVVLRNSVKYLLDNTRILFLRSIGLILDETQYHVGIVEGPRNSRWGTLENPDLPFDISKGLGSCVLLRASCKLDYRAVALLQN